MYHNVNISGEFHNVNPPMTIPRELGHFGKYLMRTNEPQRVATVATVKRKQNKSSRSNPMNKKKQE